MVGGKNTTAQSGIRVPLIANWPGHIKAGVNSDLVEASDFVPTLATLAGKSLPDDWHTDGFSFAPQLLGTRPTVRSYAFFWYDPRPGWDKSAFSRSIFALDHNYKLFTDGRMFDISGVTLKERLLDTNKLTLRQKLAQRKLKNVIRRMMQPPVSRAAMVEVDAFGIPVKK